MIGTACLNTNPIKEQYNGSTNTFSGRTKALLRSPRVWFKPLTVCLFPDEKVNWNTTRGPFLESPETFRAHFGWHNSPCIIKTKASRGPKLCRYFKLYSLYNIRKDQLYRLCRSEFYEWLFGPEKVSGVSRKSPQARVTRSMISANQRSLSKKCIGIDTC